MSFVKDKSSEDDPMGMVDLLLALRKVSHNLACFTRRSPLPSTNTHVHPLHSIVQDGYIGLDAEEDFGETGFRS